MRRPAGTLLLLASLLLVATPCRDADADAFESSVRVLDRAVTIDQDGPRHELLIGLRRLRDPRLRPFFEQLARDGSWALQVHGVLGLAELDPSGAVDVALIPRADPLAQDAIVAAALDGDMIGVEGINELLLTEDLPPLARLLLMAELIRVGETVDRDALAELARSGNIRAAGLASCMLAQLGDPSAFSAHRERMRELNQRERTLHVAWLLEAIRQDEIEAAMPWVIEQLEPAEVPPPVVSRGVLAAIELDQPVGLELWRRFLGAEPTHRELVEYVQLLMSADPVVPPAAYDGLESDDTLVSRMIAAGRAMSGSAEQVPALIALYDLAHARTTQWALFVAERLEPAQQSAFYGHVLESVEAQRPQGQRMPYAIKAAERLFEIDPQGTLELLATVKDDSATQEALLIALFEADLDETGAAAASVRRIGAGRADSIALVLLAQHAEHLGDNDKHQLGLIASGGGRLSPALEAQAAWLYLRHTLSTDRALARIFEPEQP